jgi:hypothetical protein
MAKTADDLSKLAPDFIKLTKETLFGDIWKRPELSARDRSLITITVLKTKAGTGGRDHQNEHSKSRNTLGGKSERHRAS